MADKRQQLAFLDGLRGFASLWVLIGHVMFLTGYKFGIFAQPDLAVELFIIISGFLMTFHYQLRQEREPWTESSTWKSFWIRRFFRIAPLYYVCLGFAFYFGPDLWQARLDAAAVIPGSMAETMLYANRYLDQSFTNIVMHLSFVFGATYTHNFRTPLPDWSIGLEMQYYALFPFLMLLALKVGRPVGIALLVAAFWIFGVWLNANGFVVGAFSMLPLKFHLFASGMLVAMSIHAKGHRKWIFLIGAIAVVFVPLGGGRDWLHRAIKIAVILGFFGFLYREKLDALTGRVIDGLDWLLSNRASRWIGDLSYGVYLIHLLVLLPVCAWLAQAFPQLAPIPRFSAALISTVITTYALSWLAHRFIEQPGIELGRKVASLAKPTREALISG